jgi:hypothetical protein
MNTTIPKKISRRDKLVDSMAKKLADGNGVAKVITTHRKRRLQTMKYVYIALALSVVSTTITYFVMTGKIAPGLTGANEVVVAVPEKTSLDLLNDDLTAKKIGPDQYALFIRDYLIRYDSLPAVYQVPFSGLTSGEVYRALYNIWPKLSLRTRSDLLREMPFLANKWEKFAVEQHP